MIRTRFAPSPTGYLHIGGARTALFSWLYARKHGGVFILRIEDTDLERSTPESVNAILEGMSWLGLDYDEGPFFQTQRMVRYQQVLQHLLATEQAYYCYCSKEELETLRNEQMARKEKPRYDGRYRDYHGPIPEGIEPVIRFKNPLAGDVVFEDLIHGRIAISNTELDDLIIARADGTPTYNFCVVVDDMDMQITHVIRGDDHINNTPRQINILQALGVPVPLYAHVPMILGPDGKRLSKRQGAVGVTQYRDDGILPEALLNYLVRLGWSYGDQEIFSVDEMIQRFDIRDVNKAASALNPDKLLWLNQHYLKHSDPVHLARYLAHHLGQLDIDPSAGPDLQAIGKLYADRSKTLVDMVKACAFFYREVEQFDTKAAHQHFTIEAIPILTALHTALNELPDWHAAAIHECMHQLAEQLQVKLVKIAQPLRVAITGTAASPPMDTTLALLGREKTVQRIANAVAFIQQSAGEGA